MTGSNLPDDHRLLTAVYYGMGVVALGMLALLGGLWTGITPDEAARPVGVVAIAGTIGVTLYAASALGSRVETGPLAEWNRSIRTMGAINMAVAMLLVAYPSIA